PCFAFYATVLGFVGLALSAISPSAYAEGFPGAARVVLLNGISGSNPDLDKQLEKTFLSAFKNSGYATVVKNGAEMTDLSRELQSGQNVAVFWISHAAPGSESGFSKAEALITDTQGRDVKEVFQKIHPNMQWVSIVGCDAQGILDDFKARGYY